MNNKTTLTEQQVTSYRREGYLIIDRPIFGEAKFTALQRHFEQKLERLPSNVRPEAMDVPHFTDPKLFEWLFSSEVLDIVEQIVGPDIALFSSHFICKPGGSGKRVPWHEDSAYWKGLMNPMEVVTLWLAIDPSTRANGCMKLIPRTFNGFSDYEPCDEKTNVFPTEIKRNQFDANKAVHIELQPGHASLHDARIIHGSDANTSSMRRCGYTMRFMSTKVRFNHETAGAWHQIYLARGRDHAGNVYADPTKSYEHLAHYREESGRKGH